MDGWINMIKLANNMLVYEVYKRNEKKNLFCAHWGIKFILWSSFPYLVLSF